MKITIGGETLDTETMNVTMNNTKYDPSITINPVNPPKSDYSILLKTTDKNLEYYYSQSFEKDDPSQARWKPEDFEKHVIQNQPTKNVGRIFTDYRNILKRRYLDPKLIPDFTKIVFRIDDEENPKRYEIQISDIWNGNKEESILWYPFGGEKNPKKDFHLQIQIDIPLISQLYSMFQQSNIKILGLNYYMITKLLDRQQAILRTDLYMSSPPIRNLCSDENHVTLIFSQSPLNFCQADIDLKNKEQNLIYQVKLPEKNSCDFYQNFIDLANESKTCSFAYFYIALQKKQSNTVTI